MKFIVLTSFFFKQRPQRGQSPVEHRGTFVFHSVCPFVPLRPSQTWNLPSQAWNLSSQAWNLSSQALNLWGQTNKSPPVFYRTSSPLGPLPKKKLVKTMNFICYRRDSVAGPLERGSTESQSVAYSDLCLLHVWLEQTRQIKIISFIGRPDFSDFFGRASWACSHLLTEPDGKTMSPI